MTNRSDAKSPDLIERWGYGILVLLTAVLFYPIMRTYAYTDVYEFLYHAGNDSFIDVFIQGGRPLYGLLNKFSLTIVSTVDQLAWLRVFGVAGLIASTLVFYALLRKYLFQNYLPLLAALFFLFTPSAGIIGLWVGTYQVGWALAAALMGGYLAGEGWNNIQSKRAWLKFATGCLLGLLALLTYQPAFTAFVIPGLLVFMKEFQVKRTAGFLLVYFLLYVVYYGVFNLILELTGLPPLTRTGLTQDIPGKLTWFFRGPLKMVFEDNFIFYRNAWLKVASLIFLVPALAGVFHLVREKTNPMRLTVLAVLGAFLFASYVPNLISSDNWVSYRTLSTLFLFKIVLVFTGVQVIQQRYRHVFLFVTAFSVWLLVNSWYNIRGFADIQHKEYEVIAREVDRLIPELKQKRQLVFIMPELGFLAKNRVVRRVVSDEFGSLSSSRDWVPMPMVKQILRERNETDLEKDLEVIALPGSERNKLSAYKDAPVLDAGALFLKSETP